MFVSTTYRTCTHMCTYSKCMFYVVVAVCGYTLGKLKLVLQLLFGIHPDLQHVKKYPPNPPFQILTFSCVQTS